MDNKIKHLELIEDIVSRMASNSFMLKGWAVTLVAGIFALATKDADKLYFIVAYIPIIIFWGLDAYYLRQERLYRSLYDRVRLINEENIDFSLKLSDIEYEIDKNDYFSCILSKTEIFFYIPLALVCGSIIMLSFS